RLVGNADDDILIDGTTAYDNDRLALGLLRGVWTNPAATYEARVAALRSSATLPDGIRLDAGTVSHDDSADVMTGSTGLDWVLFDRILDRATDFSDEAFDPDRDFIGNP